MRGFRVQGLVIKLITFFLLFFVFLYSTPYALNPIIAQDATPSASTYLDNIGYSKITPDSPLYFLKAVRESLEMKLAATERVKNLRTLEFAIRRIRETKTLVGKNEDYIPPTLVRYLFYLTKLDPGSVEDLANNLSVHLNVLMSIYPNVQDLRAKASIRDTLNQVIQRSDVNSFVKLSVCNLFSKEASSSSLNQTEQVVLKDRANKCLQLLGKATLH